MAASAENALTSNEPSGHKWLATKAVRSGTAEVCWCLPLDVATGQVVQAHLDSQNRANLADLAEKPEAA